MAALIVCAVLACAAPRQAQRSGPEELQVVAGTARFRIEYSARDAEAARDVARILPSAAERASRWGELTSPVTIVVHPTHEALEVAVHRKDHPWLRAWARFDRVDLQSPRTWALFGASGDALEELLTHEITHCVLYQRAGNRSTWMTRAMPLWFREGMASVTAGQRHRWMGMDGLREHYAGATELVAGGAHGNGATGSAGARVADPGRCDPISDPDPLYQNQAYLVYGAAHHAFEFLVQRYGERGVGELLDGMAGGQRFPAAFLDATGIEVERFEAEFRRYVAWSEWAGRAER